MDITVTSRLAIDARSSTPVEVGCIADKRLVVVAAVSDAGQVLSACHSVVIDEPTVPNVASCFRPTTKTSDVAFSIVTPHITAGSSLPTQFKYSI